MISEGIWTKGKCEQKTKKQEARITHKMPPEALCTPEGCWKFKLGLGTKGGNRIIARFRVHKI